MFPSISSVLKFAAFLLCLPVLLAAETKVLVDAIPSGGTFLGTSPVGLPFHDAEAVEVKTIEAGLSGAISRLYESAKQNGIGYICLLAAPGENPIEVFVAPANAKLKLSRKNTALMVVFYRDGTVPAKPVVFSTEKLGTGKAQVSTQFQKIAVPPGVTTAGWVYFNLSRIQAEALKSGSETAFIQISGTGAKSPVAIPGMKEPLTAYDGEATLTAAWYIDQKTEEAMRRQAEAKQNIPPAKAPAP